MLFSDHEFPGLQHQAYAMLQNQLRDSGPEQDPDQASDQPTAGRSLNDHQNPRPLTKAIQSQGQLQTSSKLNYQ
ncbi:hypothetical protein MRX96_043975 [Rhipicephalus microplus]